MKKPDNLSLFPGPIQPRMKSAEPLDVWEAARTLRQGGARVYRAGHSHHLVNGKRVGNKRLKSMARKVRETSGQRLRTMRNCDLTDSSNF